MDLIGNPLNAEVIAGVAFITTLFLSTQLSVIMVTALCRQPASFESLPTMALLIKCLQLTINMSLREIKARSISLV